MALYRRVHPFAKSYRLRGWRGWSALLGGVVRPQVRGVSPRISAQHKSAHDPAQNPGEVARRLIGRVRADSNSISSGTLPSAIVG